MTEEQIYKAAKQYPYDRVKDKITDADREEAKKTFPGSYNMQSAFISGIAYQICKEIDCKKVPKHEFKPFDKVLVRSKDNTNNRWLPAIYAYYDDVVSHVTIDHRMYAKGDCIPYAGNESLVGTTNNPKED